MRPDQTPVLPPRERIADAANALFFEHGIARVSVDAIAARAGSTKMTLYRYFESKDALVVEWLERLTESYSDVLDQLAQQYPQTPEDQLLGFVDFIVQDLERAGYRGCPFTNTLAELAEVEHPARKLIQQHKLRQFERFCALCQQLGLDKYRHVAEELTLLMEGAQMVAQIKVIECVGEKLKRMVEQRLFPSRQPACGKTHG